MGSGRTKKRHLAQSRGFSKVWGDDDRLFESESFGPIGLEQHVG